MGWNGSDKARDGSSHTSGKPARTSKPVAASAGGRKNTGAILAIVGSVVVMVGVGVFWLRTGRPRSAVPTGKDARAVKIVEVAPVATNAAVAAVVKPVVPQKPKKPEMVVPPGMVAVTNGNKVIVMTPKEAETFRRAQRDTTLRTRTEKVLKLLASIPVGSPIPPMPGGLDMDAELQETLNNKIEILEDDTEREIEQKRFVMAFKEYMIEEINKGKTANQVYAEYVEQMNKIADLTTSGSRMTRELAAEGDLEVAEEFLKKVNAKIEALGGHPIVIKRGPTPVLPTNNGEVK